MATRYAHVNIIARDWRRLCEFYEKVFDCEPWSSERDHHGAFPHRGLPQWHLEECRVRCHLPAAATAGQALCQPRRERQPQATRQLTTSTPRAVRYMWYRKEFATPFQAGRTLLHFGAVD